MAAVVLIDIGYTSCTIFFEWYFGFGGFAIGTQRLGSVIIYVYLPFYNTAFNEKFKKTDKDPNQQVFLLYCIVLKQYSYSKTIFISTVRISSQYTMNAICKRTDYTLREKTLYSCIRRLYIHQIFAGALYGSPHTFIYKYIISYITFLQQIQPKNRLNFLKFLNLEITNSTFLNINKQQLIT